MDPLVASGIQFAFTLGKDRLIAHVKDKVSQRVVEEAQKQVELEINGFILSIRKRTVQYLVFTGINLIGITLFYFLKSDFILYFALLTSFSFLVYSIKNFVVNFLKAISYIENFENHIKELITNEFAAAKEAGWKNKVALLINSKEAVEYYHIVLEEIIRGLANWIRHNKNVLYLRLLTLVVSSTCFSLSFRELF